MRLVDKIQPFLIHRTACTIIDKYIASVYHAWSQKKNIEPWKAKGADSSPITHSRNLSSGLWKLCYQPISQSKKVVPILLRSQKLSKIATRLKSAIYVVLQKQSHLFVISRSSRTFWTSTIKVNFLFGVDSLLNFWLWRHAPFFAL